MELAAASADLVPAETGTASSIVRPIAERVAAIERRRQARNMSHAELCRLAAVRKDAWIAIRKRRGEPRPFTLDRLEAALDGRPGRKPPQIIAAFLRLVMVELCRALRFDAEAVLATDFTINGGRNPKWVQAARVRRMAIYILAVELELENAELARAIGGTRQNVKQARDEVFDLIESDAKIQRAVFAVASMLTGRAE